MAKKFEGKLSKDLPDGRVAVPEELKNRGYYKYYLEEFHDVSQELKDRIRASVFKKGAGLEVQDRRRMDEEAAFPKEPGYYALSGGGCVSVANVKTPDMTGEMLGWWADWHGINPLRYAIWDPQDHYGLTVIKNRDRLLNPDIPNGEKNITTVHDVWESMDGGAPSNIEMHFYDPYKDFGMDESKRGTDRDMYTVAVQGYINGKVPAFAMERLCKGEDGINEMRCRFWVGYEFQPDTKTIKYKLPFFIKPPKDIVHNLIIHNYCEFSRLNQVLPGLYEEFKDQPLDI